MSIRKGQYFIAGMPDNSSGNYVTIDTTQTITATKTFSGGILATGGLLANDTLGIETNFGGLSSIFSKKNATQIGTPPQDIESTASYTMLDKDGNSIAQYTSSYNTDGSTSSGLRAYSPSNNGNHADITVYYPASGMPTTYCVTPQATTETLNGEIATCGWVNSTTNNVVHKTGNEIITGFKTFSGNNRITALQNSTVTYNTAPSSDTFTDISFRDKNGYEMGVLEHVRYPNNDTAIRLVAKGADGEWSTSLSVGRRANGTVYTSAQTPSAGDNSTNIATTAWVNTIGNNVVHKTGDETISGHKIFTNNIDRNVNAIRGQTPSTNSYSDIRFVDNNNNWLAGLEYSLLTDKSSCMSLIISDSVGDTTNVKGNIQLGVFSDGSVYTAAPTPHVSSNGTNIATTAWVNTKFQVVSTLPANPDGNVYYFIPE